MRVGVSQLQLDSHQPVYLWQYWVEPTETKFEIWEAQRVSGAHFLKTHFFTRESSQNEFLKMFVFTLATLFFVSFERGPKRRRGLTAKLAANYIRFTEYPPRAKCLNVWSTGYDSKYMVRFSEPASLTFLSLHPNETKTESLMQKQNFQKWETNFGGSQMVGRFLLKNYRRCLWYLGGGYENFNISATPFNSFFGSPNFKICFS